MREIARLTKDDGIGLQMLEYKLVPSLDVRYGRQTHAIVRNTIICDNCLAENDGLSYDDWLEWLRPYNTTEPLAIIHLTRFRY